MEQKFTEQEKNIIIEMQEYVNSLSIDDILDNKRKPDEPFETYKFRQQFSKRWLKYRLQDKGLPSWYKPIQRQEPARKIEEPISTYYGKKEDLKFNGNIS